MDPRLRLKMSSGYRICSWETQGGARIKPERHHAPLPVSFTHPPANLRHSKGPAKYLKVILSEMTNAGSNRHNT